MDLYGRRQLTEREFQVCELLTEGYSNKEIAQKLGLHYGTIKNNMRRIFDKSGMDSRLEVALWYLKHKGEQL